MLRFVVRTMVAIVVPGIMWSSGAAGQEKGVLQSTLIVDVRSEFDRPVTGATVTLAGNSESRMMTSNVDGVYTFTSIAQGFYNLSASSPLFTTASATVEITNLVESAVLVLVLDDDQFPDEMLDRFRDFDTSSNGEVSETEFTAMFAGASDAYHAYRDRCSCALTAPEIAVQAGRPYLLVSLTKSGSDMTFPTGIVDLGMLIEGRSKTMTISVENAGGGTLTGMVSSESHGGAALTVSPRNYTQGSGSAMGINLTAAPMDIGPFSGILSFTGNYDGAPVAVGIRGEVIQDPGEGEGEGEGEPPACLFLEDAKSSPAASGPLVFGLAILLFMPRRWYRRGR